MLMHRLVFIAAMTGRLFFYILAAVASVFPVGVYQQILEIILPVAIVKSTGTTIAKCVSCMELVNGLLKGCWRGGGQLCR